MTRKHANQDLPLECQMEQNLWKTVSIMALKTAFIKLNEITFFSRIIKTLQNIECLID